MDITNQPKKGTRPSERRRRHLSRREARAVFADPVGYLSSHGVECEVVETVEQGRSLAPAA